MGSIKAMLDACDRLAALDIGYDQRERWSFYDRRTDTLITDRPTEADCSSLCSAIARLGGYNIDLSDPTYTGNFVAKFRDAGFQIITFMSIDQVQPGDFILKPSAHVEFCRDKKRWYSARIDENGKASAGQAGNQTGKETGFRAPYLRKDGWEYILRPPAEKPGKDLATLASEVLNGAWGNGANRRAALIAEGYDADAVQAEVNRLITNGERKSVTKLAQEVLEGAWGNHPERARRLEAEGYDPIAVQREVNRLVIEQRVHNIAREVIAGLWGNGAARAEALGKAGHNAEAVQAEVNRILFG